MFLKIIKILLKFPQEGRLSALGIGDSVDLTLAVLNTIVSIWLSCYSRYPAALPRMGWGEGTGGGGARGSLDCWRGQGERCSGAWGSVPDGLPVAGQDRLHRRTACAGAQGPMIKRASNLANALLLLF